MFGKLMSQLSKGKQIWIRSTVTGELIFNIEGKTHHLQGGQRLCLTHVGDKYQLLGAHELHNLLKMGYLIIED